jgi:hypothetical protein
MSVRPGLVASLAVPAAFRFVLGIVTELQERVLLVGCNQIHVTTPPAIAARWTAARNVLLPPESQAAIAAVAGFHEDSGFVEELHAAKRKGDRPFCAIAAQKSPSPWLEL